MQAQKISSHHALSAQDTIAKARQGDIQALQHLIEIPLKSRDIKVRVKRRDSSLSISLMGKQVLSKKGGVGYVTRGLQKLGLDGIETAQVSAYQIGKFNPLWQENVELSSPQLQKHPKAEREHSQSQDQPASDHQIRLEKTPKGNGYSDRSHGGEHSLKPSAIARRINHSQGRVTQLQGRVTQPLRALSDPVQRPVRARRLTSARTSKRRTAAIYPGVATRSAHVRPSPLLHTPPRKSKKGNGVWFVLGALLVVLSLWGVIGFGLLRNTSGNSVPNSADATIN